jgi:hypothetical protein
MVLNIFKFPPFFSKSCKLVLDNCTLYRPRSRSAHLKCNVYKSRLQLHPTDWSTVYNFCEATPHWLTVYKSLQQSTTQPITLLLAVKAMLAHKMAGDIHKGPPYE